MEAPAWTTSVLLILGFIPGVLCENYNIAGMVAASVVAVLLAIVVIIAIVVGAVWANWFENYQKEKGRWRIPKAEVLRRKLVERARASAIEKRKGRPDGSLASGFNTYRTVDSTRSGAALETWIHELPDDKYETNGKAMKFDEEAEPRIEAELLPPNAYENTAVDANRYSSASDKEPGPTANEIHDHYRTTVISDIPDSPEDVRESSLRGSTRPAAYSSADSATGPQALDEVVMMFNEDDSN